LGQQGERVMLRVVGDQPGWVAQRLADSGAAAWVTLIPGMAHRQGLRELLSADALVLMQMPGTGQVQAVAGKTYEYLRSGRAVLAIVPEGDNLDLVRRYVHHHEHVHYPDAGTIAWAISRLMAGGRQRNQPNPEFLAKYERCALSARLVKVLNGLLSG